MSIQELSLVQLSMRDTLGADSTLSVEEPGMETPELKTSHSETTAVCGLKSYKGHVVPP